MAFLMCREMLMKVLVHHTFFHVWVYYAASLNLYQPVLLLLQHNLEGWSQPIISQLHQWAAPQCLISACPPGCHRHTNQCILHHIHLCGHVGECSGLGFLQGSPISAHITHRFQKASWADAQRCPTSPHGCAQHDEDRSFFPPSLHFSFVHLSCMLTKPFPISSRPDHESIYQGHGHHRWHAASGAVWSNTGNTGIISKSSFRLLSLF